MKTAEEVLYENIKDYLTEGKKLTTFEEWKEESSSGDNKIISDSIHRAMKEYASSALREAAERAKTKPFGTVDNYIQVVDKQSILSIIDTLK